jgi:hypothetical protein
MAEVDTETASEIAELETQLRALKRARSSGVFSVRHGDTMVQYRTLKEINAAIAAIDREIRLLRGETRKPKYVLQTTRGL